MALVLADRVQEITTTSGTGTLTLNGAVPGFQDFVTGIGSGNTTYYTIYDPTTYEWEVGIGTFTSSGTDTLSRDTVLSNSLGTTAKINLAGNQANVFVTYPSEKSVNLNAAGVAEIGEPISYADTGLIATFASTEAGYNQVVVQNKSTATNASANLNVSNDASSSTDGFAELGINSSTFSNGPGCFNIPNAAYVASSGADLSIGTYNAYDIHFATNSSTTDAMTIFDNGGTSLGGYGNPGIGNLALNKVVSGVTDITSTGGTTVLNAASTYYQRVIGTTTQTIQLPDATTLLNGTTFIVDNDSTGNVTVTDFATASLDVIPAGGLSYIYLVSNSTVAGTWTAHGYLPSIYNFNNTVADFGNATITNAVWNGNTIAYNYGGTGLTTFGAANNALYSTSATTLTAGTLPVAAGGTGLTSLTTNYVPYGNGTSAYQSSATFTYNGTTLDAANISTPGNLTFTGTGNRITGDFSNATITNRVMFQTSTTNANTTVAVVPNGTATESSFQVRNLSDPTNSGQFNLNINSTEARLVSTFNGTGTYLPMTFYTGGSERMRIDTSGNVGIGGVANTNVRLDINGISGTPPLLVRTNNNTNNNASSAIALTTDNSLYSSKIQVVRGASSASLGIAYTVVNAATESEAMRIDSSGNVGIGTTSPASKLHINGDKLFIQDTSIGSTGLNLGRRTNELYIETSGGIALSLGTNNTERMRIDSSGNIISNTTPFIGSGLSGVGQFHAVSGAGSSWYNAMIRNDGSDVYLLSSNVQTTQAAANTASFNSFRPFRWNLANGDVGIALNGSGTSIGGPLSINTAAATGGDALVVNQGGDIRIFNAGNTVSANLYCDVSGVLHSEQRLVNASYYYRLNSGVVGANVNTVQNTFGVGIALDANTQYEFEIYMLLNKTAGTTSHTLSVGFGGTAGINNISYATMGAQQAATPLVNQPAFTSMPISTAQTLVKGASTTAIVSTGYILKGTVSISTAGTFIPQYQCSAAPGGAYTTQPGSYVKVTKLGPSGANINVGGWA